MSLRTKLGWPCIDAYTRSLARQLVGIHNQFDLILGVTRGGLIPAVALSHTFNLPFQVIHASYYTEGNTRGTFKLLGLPPSQDILHKSILVVDDIIDSGGTFKQIAIVLSSFAPKRVVYSALLSKHKTLNDLELFYAELIDEGKGWIEFPWEVIKV